MILVVDDDRNVCRVLKGFLEKNGYDAITANDVEAALHEMEKEDLELVITDLKMPGKSGMDLLSASHELKPGVPVIMISAYGDVESAVCAIKQGAYDFVTKPFDENELLNVIKKALAESDNNKTLVSAYFEKEGPLYEIIGNSPGIGRVLKTIQKIAPTDSTVLIIGETGVGKELIARAIHLQSTRREGPFVKVNCAAIPETLLESELFGYERGAFTGAVTNKPGRFEIAHQGTIFLDEVGELPIHLQSKLLAVIQDRKFERLGGVKTVEVDIRIIAATNIDLHASVNKGTFRADLFYRLNVVPIHIPPLRERKEDLLQLSAYFLRKFSSRHRRNVTALSRDVVSAFVAYEWPGNIRELENVIERMVVMAETEHIGINEVPEEILGALPATEGTTLKAAIDSVSHIAEKQMLIDALNRANQNRTKAAELLGVSRRTIQNKIKEYGL